MAVSKTLSPPARKSFAQQTFAFWQPAEDTPVAKGASVAEGAPAAKVRGAKVTSPRHRATPPQEAKPLQRETASTRRVSSPVAPSVIPAEPPPTETPPTETLPTQSLPVQRSALMAELRGRAAAIASNPALDSAARFSTGAQALDACLPGGGLKRGGLCEWVAGHDASGASTLAMLAAAETMIDRHSPAAGEATGGGSKQTGVPHRGPIIVVDPNGTFHAATAIACGISPQRMVVCRPSSRRESVWAIDQALRCSSVAAVWSALPWSLDDRDARRLQLAAEQGRTPGLFVLPSSARARPSFAAVRWHVRAVPVDASRLSADQRVAAGLPLRPPLDLRILCVQLDRARNLDHAEGPLQPQAAISGSMQRKIFLAVAPDARLHSLTPAAVADLQRRSLPTIHTSAEHRHEAVAVPLAARLANPASTHARAPLEAATRRSGTSRAG
ncbi:cell division inhibitor SulA [Allorhodopirellula solitaria]|uniref:Uncharacterized protein n=1 Tax=Allorhodopirellula solitaria TaxID=2527987 RepID=A0A5C5XUQ6_9BACT|nr:cell division inhibitor SulA [Allorhodopirellula solitaria]TWT67046.1 hypothetical protein CA85_18920 [Allorhodopirellula solitaria]